MSFTAAISHRKSFSRNHRPPAAAAFPAAIRPARHAGAAFTIVEAVVALTIFGVFALSAFYAIINFNDRAARNRNAEAARAILESSIGAVLAQSSIPAATALGTDLDGDGVADGVLTTSNVPIIVQRNANATPVVAGDLYTLVKPVGTSVGLLAAGDLAMVQYMLVYSYHGTTFKVKLTTFKSAAQ